VRSVEVRAVAHITGGGIVGNLARVLPSDADAVVDQRKWEPPRIFDEMARIGRITPEEMAKTFNLGLGMVVVVPRSEVFKALDVLRSRGHRGAAEVGEITAGRGAVHLT
jgi:phosphoribosylformylglycinamidine cyclo-ligase